MKFRPCNGNCTDGGTHCGGCGRTQEEVAAFRQLVAGAVSYAQEMGYENVEDYANAMARSVYMKLGGQV